MSQQVEPPKMPDGCECVLTHRPGHLPAFPKTCGEVSCNWFTDGSLSIVSGHKIYSLTSLQGTARPSSSKSEPPAPPAWPDTLFGESDLILILNLL